MPRSSLLARLGLDRPELRAWAMYDWAASSMQTTIMVAVFPIYFVKVAGAGLAEGGATQRLATVNSVALVIIALVSPVLGAVSDYGGNKKRFIAGFMALGVGGGGRALLRPRAATRRSRAGSSSLALIGVAGGFVFYEALLPHIARPHEIDRVSTAGLRAGLRRRRDPPRAQPGVDPEAGLVRAAVGPGPGRDAGHPAGPARLPVASRSGGSCSPSRCSGGCPSRPARLESDERRGREPGAGRVRPPGRDVPRAPRLPPGVPDAAGVPDLQRRHPDHHQDGDGLRHRDRHRPERLIGAILLVQFVGIPCSFLFGMLAGRIGAKRALFLGLLAYTAISMLGYYMKTAAHFYVLAGLVGMVQGGTQALSRSLFASMVPHHKAGEFFGFFSVFEKFAGIFGPLIFAGTIAATGSSRNAILCVIAFFAVGAAILAFVDVEEGQRAARAAEPGSPSSTPAAADHVQVDRHGLAGQHREGLRVAARERRRARPRP